MAAQRSHKPLIGQVQILLPQPISLNQVKSFFVDFANRGNVGNSARNSMAAGI